MKGTQIMDTLLSLAIALVAGLFMSRIVKLLNLPAVTGYLVAGILIGPYCLGALGNLIGITGLGFTSMEYVFDSFQEIYQSPFFERIGLRYVNAFSKEKLMLGNALWKDVLNNNYIGALSFIPEQRVKNNNIAFEYELDEPTMRAKINAGLGTLNNVYKVFIFDCDLICIKQINKEEINGIIQTLHNNEVNIFEGFLSETLKQHMEPITSDE